MKRYIVSRLPSGAVRLLRDGVEIGPARAQVVMRPRVDEYAFGYLGAGPSLLGLAILLDALTVADCALYAHKHFAADCLGTATATALELTFTQAEILAWYQQFAAKETR